MADGIDGLHIDKGAFIDRNQLLINLSPTGIKKLVFDDTDHTCHLVQTTDLTALIEENKAFQNSGHDGYSPGRNYRYVAQIDDVVIQQWSKQEGCNVLAKENEAILKRLLNDPDNRAFRTGLGNI